VVLILGIRFLHCGNFELLYGTGGGLASI